MSFAKIESSMNPNAKAKGSTASGLFGLTDPTWEEQLDKNGDKYNIPPGADKNNPFYNALMAGEYSKSNIKRISGWQQAGLDEPSAMYLGHHYGVSGANKMIDKANENPNAPVRDAVSEGAYKANSAELGNKTVGDYINMIGQKIASVAGKIFKPKEKVQKPATDGSDTKMSGGDNIASSQPPVIQSKPKTSSDSFMVRPAKLSITSSGYGSSMMNSNGTSKDSGVQDSFKQMFDTSKMEGIMGQQLDELKNIVGVLRSIDGKFVDPNGKAGQPAPQKTAPPPPVDKSIPSSSINLTRKSLSA
jgi:hypothetical protein